MDKDLQVLLEKAVLSDETKAALQEAWTKKVESLRESVATELRQDFSSRFEHDKAVILEGMEKFINDALVKETVSLVEEKKALAEEKAALANKGASITAKFNSFVTKKLAEEIGEFKQNRKNLSESVSKAEKFIVRKLAEELTEYEDSKAKLVEERVALETEKKKEINEAKKLFVTKASALAEKVINEAVKAEFTQLRSELLEARKSTLGKKIFETFASEFGANFFKESAEIKKIATQVSSLEAKLVEAKKAIETKDKELLESKKQVSVSQELLERNSLMSDLLSTLNTEKRGVMRKLLESVSTGKLRENYKKFLPSVLGNTVTSVSNTDDRKALNETATSNESAQDSRRIVEGNRKGIINNEENSELSDLKRLISSSF